MKALRRFPKDENKSVKPQADMDPNAQAKRKEQVPENSRLTQFYSSSPEEKRTIDDNITGTQKETEAGETPGINNHVVGHLGIHKI